MNFVPVPYPGLSPRSDRDKAVEAAVLAGVERVGDHVPRSANAGGRRRRSRWVWFRWTACRSTKTARLGIELFGRAILLPPAGRADFIFKGAARRRAASLVTRTRGYRARRAKTIRRGRWRRLLLEPMRPSRRRSWRFHPAPLPAAAAAWLGDVKPVRERKLYFSERAAGSDESQQPHRIFSLPWTGRSPRRSIRTRPCRTSSRSRATWKTGSSRTDRRNCMRFTFTRSISC